MLHYTYELFYIVCFLFTENVSLEQFLWKINIFLSFLAALKFVKLANMVALTLNDVIINIASLN